VTLLIGFLDVLCRGLAQIALAASAGGIVFALVVLRPLGAPDPLTAALLRRSIRLIAIASVILAAARLVVLVVLHPIALADPSGPWPIREFLLTDYGKAGVASAALALGLALVAMAIARRPASRPGWAVALAMAGGLVLGTAWLAHAVSRLEGRESLMALTVLHQLGAALWVGGLTHLLLAAPVLWRETTRTTAAGQLLARFAPLAMSGVALVIGPGVLLSTRYVGDWAGLVGTGYGVMVLTKVVLLLGALGLGFMNFRLARRLSRGGGGDDALRVRTFIEAEVGVGLTVLLAAASLTSLPPAVDVVEDRASPSEVARRFLPQVPRLTSPAAAALLARAGAIDDTLATRQPEEYAWSEFNHHVAGAMVLAMGALALLERTGRAPWARHWPLIFLGLAAFMFVRNDPRAWPLGPAGFWESMLLPDVLQHRLAVLMVVGLGVFEWLVRIGRLAARSRLVFPMICTAGGAVLLTHSHAMFNLKLEFLAEVAHAPIGVLGLVLGWARWLELRLPTSDRNAPAWVGPCCLALVGALLLVYREA
jgi:putative copper resistance protein D